MSFDPYHQWLGIPLLEQPPNHYRLLGVQLFEAEPSVIDQAADRQMTHLRTCQQGPSGALAVQLMSEISAARVCLLDQEKKRAYDALLRASGAAQAPMVAAADPQLPPSAAEKPELPPLAAGELELPPLAAGAVEVPRKKVATSPFRVATTRPGTQSTRPPAAVPPANRSRAASQPSTRLHSPRPRQGKNPVIEIAKVVIGGIAGILVALLIGGYGFGVGPLGSVKSKDEPDAGTVGPNAGNESKNQAVAKPTYSVRPRVPPATQRFGQTEDPQPESDSNSKIDTAEREVAALEKLLDQPFAEVVPLLGGEFVPLQADVNSTTSSRYVWSNIAPPLSGLYFLRNKHQQQKTDFEITKPGLVLLAVYTQWRSGASGEWQEDVVVQKDLAEDGWRAVGNLDSHVSQSLGDIQKFIVFAKNCREGESFSYATEKDVAPVLILKPDAAMLANGDSGKSMSQEDRLGEPGSISAAIKGLSRRGSSFAKIQILRAGDFVPLEIDSAITSDERAFHWSKIPQELLVEKLAFLRSNAQEATLKFEITNPGIVLMAALWTDIDQGGSGEQGASSRQDLTTAGWVEAGKLISINRSSGKSDEWGLFVRYCRKGESFSCRTNASTAPTLILK